MRVHVVSAFILGFWIMLLIALIASHQYAVLQVLGIFLVFLAVLAPAVWYAAPPRPKEPEVTPLVDNAELAQLIAMRATITLHDRGRALLVLADGGRTMRPETQDMLALLDFVAEGAPDERTTPLNLSTSSEFKHKAVR